MSESSKTGPPLPRGWELPAAVRKRVGREAGAQRAIFEEGHLLLILHAPPDENARRREAFYFWRAPSGEWKSTAGKTPGVTALHGFLAKWEERLHELEEREGEAATASQYHDLINGLSPVLRAARGLHRAVQQSRELVKEDLELINARDKAAMLERAAELLTQDAHAGLNYTIARRAEEQAESARHTAASARRLNVLAALYLPLTALAGVYGMNASREEFPMIVGLGAGAGVVSALFVAWKTK